MFVYCMCVCSIVDVQIALHRVKEISLEKMGPNESMAPKITPLNECIGFKWFLHHSLSATYFYRL